MSLKRWEPAAAVNAPHAQIEYVLRGVDHRLDSADVRDVAFEAVDNVRTPKSWKHKKNYTGQYWAATTGGHVWFESLYERVALMQMDRDPAVAAISSQPMWIDWAGTPRRHAPDFFVRFRNGSAAVVDVKPLLRIKPDDVEAFDWTSALCGELGWEYFVSCRSILAGVVRAVATNSADLAGVLARALTPYELRPPGAREQRERVAATWTGRFMIDQERLDHHRLAQPYIFPETITTDNGKIYRSEAFRRGCERAGISLIHAALETGTDKPHVESGFDAIKDGFVQYLEGFTGGSVERRGRGEPTDRALALNQLQELLEDWIAIEWQNRPHAGLSDPMLPGRALTQNEMFRAYRRIAPELHVPFGVDEFIGFLPATTCTLQDYGINHRRRVYRSNRLPELRAAGAGGEGATRRCVIRYDPHNPLFVWVEHGDEFVPFRCLRDLLDEPLGGEIWQAAHDVDSTEDATARHDAAYLVDRMKRAQWVRPGKERNRAVRRAEADRDPMHLTGVSKTIAREAPPAEPDGDEVIWERGGGFSLLDDDDGVWERLT